ncbi:MAG: F0F1 ATP synthase subunit delta [Chloroflexi bacterium]|jgi:F-type H+-transporting ATPase subunit delta|nr:F0F1 ATP synthase subunit delta [Chloroflexota bacterium]
MDQSTNNNAPQASGEDLPRALVRSAVPLDETQRAAILSLCQEHLGACSSISFEVDKAVLGGVWLRIGDTVVDGSLAGKLEQLAHHLREALREALTYHRPSLT